MTKLTQIIVANNLVKPTQGVGDGSFEVRSARHEDPPQGSKKARRFKSDTEVESRSDSKFMTLDKRRVSLSQTRSGMDLREILNAK